MAIGRTPLTAQLPMGQMRWRFALDGYEPREIVPNPGPETLTLVKAGAAPPGMVLVPQGTVEDPAVHSEVKVPGFWIDAFEVTNRQFKAFVDAGGYQKRDYWTTPFVKAGRTLTWDEAMAEFRDGTGRPGPSTWELGTYREGEADLPVHGVSWYEAAAYAAFAGRTLPTVLHWYRAAGANGIFSDVLAGEQLRRARAAAGGRLGEPRSVRHRRHGRQRQGMGVEREHQRPPLRARRRLVRGGAYLPRRGCARPVHPRPGFRLPLHADRTGRPTRRWRGRCSRPNALRTRRRSATTCTRFTSGSTTTTRVRSTGASTSATTPSRSGSPSGCRSPPPMAATGCR